LVSCAKNFNLLVVDPVIGNFSAMAAFCSVVKKAKRLERIEFLGSWHMGLSPTAYQSFIDAITPHVSIQTIFFLGHKPII